MLELKDIYWNDLVGHVTDAQMIFLYRLLCIARGEAASLPGFDENAYVDKGRYGIG